MGSGDQLFRIGARLAALVLEPALERIGQLCDRAALAVQRAGTIFQCAFPDGCCVSVHRSLLGLSWGRRRGHGCNITLGFTQATSALQFSEMCRRRSPLDRDCTESEARRSSPPGVAGVALFG